MLSWFWRNGSSGDTDERGRGERAGADEKLWEQSCAARGGVRHWAGADCGHNRRKWVGKDDVAADSCGMDCGVWRCGRAARHDWVLSAGSYGVRYVDGGGKPEIFCRGDPYSCATF